MPPDWNARLQEILEPLPTENGGIAIVLATAGTPPAMAMLSSGDVLVSDGWVRVGVYGSSSTVSRLGGSFTLLVPARTAALRVEAVEASATPAGELALLEGRLHDVRPTREPPWITEMRFRASSPSAPGVPGHLRYWTAVRDWLSGSGPTPTPPPTPEQGGPRAQEENP